MSTSPTPPLAFSCQRCGHCCHGEGGIVLGHGDLARLAVAFSLTPEAFIEQYADERYGRTRLRTREDGYCTFYNDDIRGCGVHAVRPDVCRAWPFFRGNMVDESSWELVQDYCPGIVAKAGHDEFVRQGADYLREHGLLDEHGPHALRPGVKPTKNSTD